MTKCYPVIAFSRPDYYSQILVQADSEINSVKDLKGEKVAMNDIGSTSGHLGPSQVIKDNGLNPLKHIKIIYTAKEIGNFLLPGYSFFRIRLIIDKINQSISKI